MIFSILWYFLLNVTSGYLLMKPSTYLLSDYNCLRLLLCGHHLPDQRLVLLQGFTEIKFDPILSCRFFIFLLANRAGGERIRESGHLPTWWQQKKKLFSTKQPILVLWILFHHIIDINFQCSGRLKHGGARGPGLFFVLPYVDNFRRVDIVPFK